MRMSHITAVLAMLSGRSQAVRGQDPCAADPSYEIMTFAGEIGAGENFTKSFAGDLTFKLQPTADGWTIEVRTADGVDLSQITPPLRLIDTNPRNIAGWHFRNAANTGRNEGDVNAPQHRRAFVFGPAAPGPAATEPGRGVVVIDDFGLGDLLPGKRARMVYLKFSGCLAWRKASAPVTAEYSGVYRQGFEQSDFYSDDGRGPWWLEAEGADWERIRSLMVERGGRGSFVAARLRVRGHLAPFDDHGVLVGRRDTRLVVEEILAIEAIADEEFQARASAAQAIPTAR